jgi:hypothetical protein
LCFISVRQRTNEAHQDLWSQYSPAGAAVVRSQQGIGLIISYKLTTSVANVMVGDSLQVVGSTALTEERNAAATIIRRHVAEAWSVALAERVIHAASARN